MTRRPLRTSALTILVPVLVLASCGQRAPSRSESPRADRGDASNGDPSEALQVDRSEAPHVGRSEAPNADRGVSAQDAGIDRRVARLNAPARLTLFLGRRGTELGAKAETKDGIAVPGAPITVASSDPGVVRIVGRTLIPVRVGRAVVTSTTDGVSYRTHVHVVEMYDLSPRFWPRT